MNRQDPNALRSLRFSRIRCIPVRVVDPVISSQDQMIIVEIFVFFVLIFPFSNLEIKKRVCLPDRCARGVGICDTRVTEVLLGTNNTLPPLRTQPVVMQRSFLCGGQMMIVAAFLSFSSSKSVITTSVERTSPAIEPAFWSPTRTTLAGSMTPFAVRFW